MRRCSKFSLLFITDGFDQATPGLVAAALGAIPQGLAAIELRAKALSGRALFDAARHLKETTQSLQAPLLVNDRVDVALAVRAEGVHLPSAGVPVAWVRARAPEWVIGLSTHSLSEIAQAERDGADYVTYGPVFATPNKGAPVGLDMLRRAAGSAAIPIFALGGVGRDQAAACVAAGARIACIRAVLGGSAERAATEARALATVVQMGS